MVRDDLLYCHHQLRSHHLSLTNCNSRNVNSHRQTARAVGPSHTEGILFPRNTKKIELGLLLSFHRDWYSCCCSPNKPLPACDLLFKILSFFILQFDAVWSEQLSASINCVHHNNPTSVCAFNPLNPELNPVCYLLALLEAHHFLHVSRIRVKLLTFRLLMSCIYMEHHS